MDVQQAAEVYRVKFSDVAELVEVYTRQLLRDALFLPLGKLDGAGVGDRCRLVLTLPVGRHDFRVQGAIEALCREPRCGVRLRLEPLDPGLRAALEALGGGEAARAALIRAPQPVYHPYVVQNPRITPQELAAMARNPNVSADALRLIVDNPRHMADPAIRLNVVRNPRTDLQAAQRFLAPLSQSQLRQLCTSDEIRPALRSACRRLLGRVSG